MQSVRPGDARAHNWSRCPSRLALDISATRRPGMASPPAWVRQYRIMYPLPASCRAARPLRAVGISGMPPLSLRDACAPSCRSSDRRGLPDSHDSQATCVAAADLPGVGACLRPDDGRVFSRGPAPQQLQRQSSQHSPARGTCPTPVGIFFLCDAPCRQASLVFVLLCDHMIMSCMRSAQQCHRVQLQSESAMASARWQSDAPRLSSIIASHRPTDCALPCAGFLAFL